MSFTSFTFCHFHLLWETGKGGPPCVCPTRFFNILTPHPRDRARNYNFSFRRSNCCTGGNDLNLHRAAKPSVEWSEIKSVKTCFHFLYSFWSNIAAKPLGVQCKGEEQETLRLSSPHVERTRLTSNAVFRLQMISCFFLNNELFIWDLYVLIWWLLTVSSSKSWESRKCFPTKKKNPLTHYPIQYKDKAWKSSWSWLVSLSPVSRPTCIHSRLNFLPCTFRDFLIRSPHQNMKWVIRPRTACFFLDHRYTLFVAAHACPHLHKHTHTYVYRK